MTTPYTRPEPTEQDKIEAQKTADALIKKYGLKLFWKLLGMFCLENVLLVREINEHRAARGIEPLKTFDV